MTACERIIRVIGPRERREAQAVNTTSRAGDWQQGLSPFNLGPVRLYRGYASKNFENAWQYAKLYQLHADSEGNPMPEYFKWARAGWSKLWAVRYPMGKGAKPLCSFWDGEKLPYLEARQRIYVPLYRDAVKGTEAFRILKEKFEREGTITLFDFDGYDYLSLNMTLKQVLLNPDRICGHSFVLAMMLRYGENFSIEQVLTDE